MCKYTLKIENSQKSPKLFSHHPRFAYRAVDIRFGSVSWKQLSKNLILVIVNPYFNFAGVIESLRFYDKYIKSSCVFQLY